jgi:hypothetical protein
MPYSSYKTCIGNALRASDSAIIKQTSCRVSWLCYSHSKVFSCTKVKLTQTFNRQGTVITGICNLIWRLRLITEPEGWHPIPLTSSKQRLTHPCILRSIFNRRILGLCHISVLLILHRGNNLIFLRAAIIIQLIVNWLVHIRPIIVYSLRLHFLGVARSDWLVDWHSWS